MNRRRVEDSQHHIDADTFQDIKHRQDVQTKFIDTSRPQFHDSEQHIDRRTFEDVKRRDDLQKKFVQQADVSDNYGSRGHSSSGYNHNMNDQQFYDAFDARKPGSGTIPPHVFEDILRKDKMKREFIRKFTNVYDDDHSPHAYDNTHKPGYDSHYDTHTSHVRTHSPSYRRSPTHSPAYRYSPPHHDNPPYPVRSASPSMPGYHASPKRVKILSSNMNGRWTNEIEDYLSRYWNSESSFASVYPILLKLEREEGPGWRLDRIRDPNAVHHDAVPQSTVNFCFPPDQAAYSIWRQKVDYR